MNKEKYVKPKTDLISFSKEDIITTSAPSFPSAYGDDAADNDVEWDDWSPWY